MKNHVLRPLYVAIVFVAAILLVRSLVVPADFGIHGKNFTYGFYRKASIDDWKAFQVKYQGKDYCQECHEDEYEENAVFVHSIIECENCHGAAFEHPDDPEVLEIDRSRDLCLRCHSALPYPGSLRKELPAIDSEDHFESENCSLCHNPHNPDLEQM
jgi:predicted CXXCH cytochrome family protein